MAHVLTRGTLTFGVFPNCLFQKENNLFLASQTLQQTLMNQVFIPQYLKEDLSLLSNMKKWDQNCLLKNSWA